MDQIRRVADAGADIVRFWRGSAREGRRGAEDQDVGESLIPIIADIHFNSTSASKVIDVAWTASA